MVVPERALERSADSRRKLHARHLENHLLRRDRLRPEELAQLPPRLAAQRDAARDLVPVVLGLNAIAAGTLEVGGRVARALLLRPGDERRRLLVPPADDRPLDAILMLRPHVEEAGSLRRAEPLVAVPCIEICAERLEVERNLPGSVRAVDDGDEAGLAARRTISATGSSTPVADVMWEAYTTRVRSVRRGEERLDDVADRQRRSPPGRSAPPSRAQIASQARSHAPYSSPVASTSSPGWRSSERAAMFTPVVAFWTKVRSSGSAPT